MRTTYVDRMMQPLHRWVWSDIDRRIRKLLTFAEVETDGGRDILRAAEVTPDPLLRRLYLEHAIDELRHGDLFRERGGTLMRAHPARSGGLFNGTPLPGGHGLDDLAIEGVPDRRLLAFLHVAEKAAAGRFAVYRQVVDDDPSTRAIFEQILRDEVFHMNYTYTQLARLSPESYRREVWHARASRLWQRYLRVAAGIAAVASAGVLTAIYFLLLPPFAWMARRAERREPLGWNPVSGDGRESPRSQVPDMNILGISAHYHDSAAALVVDGVPVAAVQEERLSRHKNDAGFPAGAIEWCLAHAGLEPDDLDAVVFYERSMLKFDRVLTSALRAFPRSWRSFPAAIKNSLGEKVWVRGIISSHLGVPASKVFFTGHHASHAAAAFLTAPTRRAAILTADGVGEWATVTAGHGERRPNGTDITLQREIRYPHSLGMLYLDVHRVPRLRGQRGRIQGDGAGRLRATDAGRQGAHGDPPHRGRRIRPRPRLLRVPHDGQAIGPRSVSSSCSVPRAAATIRSISTLRTGSASPTARPACSACSRTRWWT